MPKPDMAKHFAEEAKRAREERDALQKEYEKTKKRYEDPRGPSRTEPFFNETLEKQKAAAEAAEQRVKEWERRQRGEPLPEAKEK